MGRVAFRCEQRGLGDVLRSRLLGGYDGAGRWDVVLANIGDGAEQQLVEIHEGLHHELQATCGIGLVSAFSAMLADRGYRRLALRELFDALVFGCQATHEVFATFVSSSVVGLPTARRLLAGNEEYLGHLERALGLVALPGVSSRFRDTATAAVLRCCMAPASMLDLVGVGFPSLVATFTEGGSQPDDLLAAFEATGGPGSWAVVVDELHERYPGTKGSGSQGRKVTTARSWVLGVGRPLTGTFGTQCGRSRRTLCCAAATSTSHLSSPPQAAPLWSGKTCLISLSV